MSEDNRSEQVLKALADPTRLRLVRALAEAPRYVEELATVTALSAPTISHHLKKLEAAGLVTRRKEQYYVMYRLCDEVLEQRLRDLIGTGRATPPVEEERLDAYRRRILGTFFSAGRLRQLPAQRKKRLVVLAAFAADFAGGRDYTENEVNDIIGRRCSDYCTVRREMTDAGLMARRREPGGGNLYQRTGDVDVAALPAPGPAGKADMPLSRDERKQRVELYKQSSRTAGVYGIRNRETGRLLLGSALNLHGPLNRHRAQLDFGSHPCKALQADWNRLGPEAFEFAVLDTLDRRLEGLERDKALRELEQEWIANFQPFAERCYNGSEQIRTRAF